MDAEIVPGARSEITALQTDIQDRQLQMALRIALGSTGASGAGGTLNTDEIELRPLDRALASASVLSQISSSSTELLNMCRNFFSLRQSAKSRDWQFGICDKSSALVEAVSGSKLPGSIASRMIEEVETISREAVFQILLRDLLEAAADGAVCGMRDTSSIPFTR